MDTKAEKLIDATHAINKVNQFNRKVYPQDIKNMCISFTKTENTSIMQVDNAVMSILLRFIEPNDDYVSR